MSRAGDLTQYGRPPKVCPDTNGCHDLHRTTPFDTLRPQIVNECLLSDLEKSFHHESAIIVFRSEVHLSVCIQMMKREIQTPD